MKKACFLPSIVVEIWVTLAKPDPPLIGETRVVKVSSERAFTIAGSNLIGMVEMCYKKKKKKKKECPKVEIYEDRYRLGLEEAITAA